MERELWRWDAVELAAAIRSRKVSSREAVRSVLGRLDAVNPVINAVTVLLADPALAAADVADALVKRGETLGPLHGVPVTIKENIDQEGQATPNGVVAFKDVTATSDSPPVANWKRAGAIIVGRTNTPAFSIRWHTDNALRGRTFNPWSRERTPGGSSGGAAAALASGIAPLAHGNDLGGSIRYPAYCCGVVGIRPTLGRVPAYNPTAADERPPGLQLMSVQGPLARRVRDVQLGLRAMAARDARDPWWAPAPHDGPPSPRPIRVALTVDPSGQGVHPDVAAAVRAAGAALSEAGYAVEEVDPPDVAGVAETWRAQHGDADVVRCTELLLEEGEAPGLGDYLKLLAQRSTHLRRWLLFLEQYPLVVGPVSTEPPFIVGFDVESVERTREVMIAQRLLVAVNLLGLPAASVPTGLRSGVPLGVQVIGSRYREDLCLEAAEVIEAQRSLPTPIDPVR